MLNDYGALGNSHINRSENGRWDTSKRQFQKGKCLCPINYMGFPKIFRHTHIYCKCHDIYPTTSDCPMATATQKSPALCVSFIDHRLVMSPDDAPVPTTGLWSHMCHGQVTYPTW
jgi:hypothetical protein